MMPVNVCLQSPSEANKSVKPSQEMRGFICDVNQCMGRRMSEGGTGLHVLGTVNLNTCQYVAFSHHVLLRQRPRCVF